MDNLGNFLGNAAMSTSSYLSSKMKQPEFSRARESMNNAYQDAKSKYNTMKDSVASNEYLNNGYQDAKSKYNTMKNRVASNEYLNNAYQDAKSKYNTMKNRFTSSFYGNQNSMGGKRGTRRRKRCSVIRRRKNKSCRTRRTRRKR
jgi:acyl carrier protein phosphodiesterase